MKLLNRQNNLKEYLKAEQNSVYDSDQMIYWYIDILIIKFFQMNLEKMYLIIDECTTLIWRTYLRFNIFSNF